MNQIEWKFSEPLENENTTSTFEQKYGVLIDPALKQIIEEHNGGIPSKQVFDVPRKGMVFANLLSFNRSGEETVYMAITNFLVGNKLSIIPFAENGFGDYICAKGNEIVFWDHESGNIETIASSFSDFLNLLHE